MTVGVKQGPVSGNADHGWHKIMTAIANALLTAVGNGGITVASLPASPTMGQRNFVTDANATTFLSVVAGGGTNHVPVVYDGTHWVIG